MIALNAIFVTVGMFQLNVTFKSRICSSSHRFTDFRFLSIFFFFFFPFKAIFASVARGDGGWMLPWTNMYWDFTPNATVYDSAHTKVTVNSVVHTDQHLKLHIPAISEPIAKIVVNATALPETESLTVLVIGDSPDGKVLDTVVTFGGVFKTSDNVAFQPGQWVFFNVSSSVSTFFGQTVELSVNFAQSAADGPMDPPARKHRHHPVGAIVGGTIGGVALLVAIVTCCVCAARKRRRCRLQRMAVTPSAPTSGEPSMYLPPAYRV